MIQIPNGYERCEWSEATHALSNGEVSEVERNMPELHTLRVRGALLIYACLDAFGIVPLRKLPELDLSPLTEDEFYQLRPGDTFTCTGSPTTWKVDGIRVISDNVTWFKHEARHMTPTPETARRLRGEGKQ